MAISANTLFHFVSEFDYLVGILEGKIYPRYCLEHFNFKPTGEDIQDVGIPMICFCDIPLSQIKNHIAHYGNYAIGMSKSWATKNRITPILYVAPNAKLKIYIKKTLKQKMSSLGALTSDTFHQVMYSAIHHLPYLKPTKGIFWRNGILENKPKNFYNEREWRYVPEISESYSNSKLVFLQKDTFLNAPIRERFNTIARQSALEYTEDDIKYIIIPKDDMDKFMRHMKESAFFQNKIPQLMSKVITVENIKQDF